MKNIYSRVGFIAKTGSTIGFALELVYSSDCCAASMMNAKTHLTTGATVLAMIGAVLYCEEITAPVDYGNVTHVVYWEKWTAFERDAMKAVVDKYNATQGKEKHIFVDFEPCSDLADKTLLATSGGIPPDIAGLSTISLAAFADNSAVMPLDDYCRKYGIKESDYVPNYWDQMYYRGHVYAMPSTPDSTALHYNRQAFREAGLDPNKPPQTIEELDVWPRS